MRPEPVLRRHADHEPGLTCRPALGYGLCEVLEERGDEWLLTSPLPGMEGERCYGFPDDLKGEAEHWLIRFASSIGAVFPEAAASAPDDDLICGLCGGLKEHGEMKRTCIAGEWVWVCADCEEMAWPRPPETTAAPAAEKE